MKKHMQTMHPGFTFTPTKISAQATAMMPAVAAGSSSMGGGVAADSGGSRCGEGPEPM